MVESSICKSYERNDIDPKLNIGFSHTPLPFIIIPSLSILLNGGVLASKFFRKKKTTREEY